MRDNQKGQALIIIVLMIALMLTVITAVSYQSTVEIQSSKQQEESVRALAAADSGIEVGLRLANSITAIASRTFLYNDPQVNLSLPGIDAARSAIIITNTSPTEFSSPVISVDDQYSFYAKEYPTFTGADLSGTLNVFFGSDGTGTTCASSGRDRPAIEITYMFGSSNDQIARDIADPCNTGQRVLGSNHLSILTPTGAIDGSNYNYQVAINPAVYPSLKIIIVRPLFASTRVGFSSATAFPQQGKVIESRAYSISGPSKIVSVFQSLPQLPSDFFVTSF